MWNNFKRQRAFSLVEILVTISIFLVMIFIGSDYIINSLKTSRIAEEQDTAVQNARNAMNIMTKEIRGANSSEQGDYPLNEVEDDSFTYFTDTDDDMQTEKVRYFLTGTDLIKTVTEPGALNDYTGAVSTTTISRYVNNQEEAVFRYYDSEYNETASINEIRLIKVILKVNVTPEKMPNDYYVETDVTLRNLKSNL